MFHFHRFDDVSENYSQFETNLNNFNNQILNTFNNEEKDNNNNNNNNDNNNNKFETNSNLKKIISIDFEKEIKSNNFPKIEKYLPLMLNFKYNDIASNNNENNLNLMILIKNFQNILSYLYSIQNKISLNNNKIERYLNTLENKNNNISKNNNIISNLKKQNKNLLNRSLIYQRVLNSKESKDNNKNVLKKCLYYCDVCYDKHYDNYEDFHKHYVKNHIDPNLNDGNNFTILKRNFDQFYFNNKFNEMSFEINNLLNNIYQNDDDFNNFNNVSYNKNYNNSLFKSGNMKITIEDKNIHNKNNFSINNNKKLSEEDKKNFLLKIEELQNNQRQKYINLLENFQTFKQQIFQQLNNINKNKK